jgi:NADH-quinone oxidoreductase subunit N
MDTTLALAPLVVVVGGALAVLLLEAFLGPKRPNLPAVLAIAALVLAGLFTVVNGRSGPGGYFGGRLILDPPAVLLLSVLCVLGIFVLLMSLRYAGRQDVNVGQLAGLLLIALAGAMIMVSSSDWLVVFLGLEVLSVASYALTGLKRKDPASAEAAAKYFLLGGFAGAFFVFGLALLFGTSGGLDLAAGLAASPGTSSPSPAAAVGFGLVLAALFFKVAIAPFHMWAPDVYEGAPTPVTVFLTVAPKAAGLLVIFRALRPVLRMEGAAAIFLPALSVAAVLTMFAGNLAALRQRSVKRMLAYSSIAHSGYLLVAVVAGDGPSLVFYLVAYLFMNAGAFGILVAVTGEGSERPALDDLAGLGRRDPWLAASFAVFLLSLAGFPPTAGFLAKFYAFGSAVREGHVALTVAAVLASLVSVAFYLKVIVAMYMEEGEAGTFVERENPALYLVVFLCLLGVIELGLWPGNLLTVVRQAFPLTF